MKILRAMVRRLQLWREEREMDAVLRGLDREILNLRTRQMHQLLADARAAGLLA